MRITLIHNPGAGDEGPTGEQVASLIRKAGHEVMYQSSKDKDFPSVLKNPGDLVVVAGGDGTVRKAALQLFGTGVPITILPLGTANNISRALRIEGPLEEIIAGWDLNNRIRFDAGVVSGPFGQTRFIEGMGLGLFSTAMALLNSVDDEHSIEFDDADSKIHSDISSLKGLIASYQATDLTVTLDGKDFSGRYLLVEAMNINFVGPNLFLAPEADPGDGSLDFVLVGESERDEFEAYLTTMREHKYTSANVTVRRGKKLEFQWQGDEIHIDDKVWTKRISRCGPGPITIEVSIEKHALEFLAP